MLGKYCIGSVDVANKDRVGTPVLEYLQQDGQTDFYTTMKRRVESHFRETKVLPARLFVFRGSAFLRSFHQVANTKSIPCVDVPFVTNECYVECSV